MTNTFGAHIRVRNVNNALPWGMRLLQTQGRPASSRLLNVVRVDGPVSTTYSKPQERVLFDPVRDANPFFHLLDSVWMLGGSQKAALPVAVLKSIAQFSDNGSTFHGAYGHRLRKAFGLDQIENAIQLLSEKPDTRQCVLSIWNPGLDMKIDTKDMPCNDMIMLDIVDGALNMTVCNRSNDAVWGAYGANAVQFSMLQEYIAIAVGVDVGKYTQQSNNFHVYVDNPYWVYWNSVDHRNVVASVSPYDAAQVAHRPLASSAADVALLRRDCETLSAAVEAFGVLTTNVSYKSSFGQQVIAPVVHAHMLYKTGCCESAIKALDEVAAPDWRRAMQEWVLRRAHKAAQ